MKEFNTTGACNPEKHYCIKRENLINQTLNNIEKGKYFVIYAPRQTGKTTHFHFLIQEIETNPLYSNYFPILLSFEGYRKVKYKKFYKRLEKLIIKTLKKKIKKEIQLELEDSIDLLNFLEDFRNIFGKKLILIIDEYEGISYEAEEDFLHILRNLYHTNNGESIQSVILVGVNATIDVKLERTTSPFNIVDSQRIPYFSEQEVITLINQYEKETGQEIDDKVKKAIFMETGGQPGLVNLVCKELVNTYPAKSYKRISYTQFTSFLQSFIIKKTDRNIENIINKAKQNKLLIENILFGDGVDFSINNEKIKDLYYNGIIDEEKGKAIIKIPIYKKILFDAFRPLINGEIDYFPGINNLQQFLTPQGDLDIDKLLDAYILYIKRRGFKAFQNYNLHETAFHYSLDSFLYFFVEELGGNIFLETPTGRGRIDIIILHNNKKYIIEIKKFRSNYSYEKGKKQLAEYLSSENLDTGYYIVFSKVHSIEKKETNIINNKTIFSLIIPIHPPIPSKL